MWDPRSRRYFRPSCSSLSRTMRGAGAAGRPRLRCGETTFRLEVFAIPDNYACDTAEGWPAPEGSRPPGNLVIVEESPERPRLATRARARVQVCGELVLQDQDDVTASTPERGPTAFFRRHWIALLVVAVALFLLIALARYIQHKQPVPAPGGPGRGGQNGPVSVSVATAASGDIQLRIPALGTVTPLGAKATPWRRSTPAPTRRPCSRRKGICGATRRCWSMPS